MSNKRRGKDIYWYTPNKKKPIITSSTSTRDLIITLYEQYKDLQVVYEHIQYDQEAKDVVMKLLQYYKK